MPTGRVGGGQGTGDFGAYMVSFVCLGSSDGHFCVQKVMELRGRATVWGMSSLRVRHNSFWEKLLFTVHRLQDVFVVFDFSSVLFVALNSLNFCLLYNRIC